MKKHFKAKKFDSASQDILDVATRVINDYRNQGYKLSLRQLYYQLVSKNVVVNTEASYKRVGNIIADARIAGMADWDMIEDRNRETVVPSFWTTPAQIIETCARAYRINKWLTQPNYVEVMVEKQALEGVLEPVCNRWDVPFTSNKGYSSVTMMFEAGQRIEKEFKRRLIERGLVKPLMIAGRGDVLDWLVDNKFVVPANGEDDPQQELKQTALTEKAIRENLPQVTVIYLGDHDPSGIDMTRDVAERLSMFSDFTPITVKRIALNMDQIDELQPPENPAKMTDSRANDYVAKFGDSSWELDAVKPDALAALVEDAIEQEIDFDKWKKAQAKQASERKTLEKILKGLK